MSWTLSDSGTKTPTVSGACTVTSATPAVVTFTNNFAAGDRFFFTGTTAPTGTTLFTVYFVIAAGLSGSSFEFSTTLGGSAVATSSTGTAVVCNPIQTLATDTNNATFVLEIDMSLLAMGDLVEAHIYTITLSGGVAARAWKGAWQHLQTNPHKISPPIASDQSLTASIFQSAGTARAFPWKILRV
jgi:hypothetical protein